MAHLRVEARGGVLGLLYEAGHVFEEEVVHVLLVHVPQLDALGRVAVGNGVTGVARHNQYRISGVAGAGLITGLRGDRSTGWLLDDV